MDLPEIMQVGKPLPQAIGRCADLYHDVRELRLAMEKEVAEIKARENEIEDHIINTLSAAAAAAGDTGAAGLKYRAQLVVKPKPKLAEWGIFTSWVRKNDFFNMIQKRINEKAVEEWMEQNPDRGPAPGTEVINVKTISVTKI